MLFVGHAKTIYLPVEIAIDGRDNNYRDNTRRLLLPIARRIVYGRVLHDSDENHVFRTTGKRWIFKRVYRLAARNGSASGGGRSKFPIAEMSTFKTRSFPKPRSCRADKTKTVHGSMGTGICSFLKTSRVVFFFFFKFSLLVSLGSESKIAIRPQSGRAQNAEIIFVGSAESTRPFRQ